MSSPPLLLLGFGDVGRAIALVLAERRDPRRISATTRRAEREAELVAAGVRAIVAPALGPAHLEELARGAHVVVSFPPDGATDARVAPACAEAARIVYVSSTAVYGPRGDVDDATPTDASAPRAGPRLAAESVWRAQGAIVLRAPAIYGPGSGLIGRIRRGEHRIPGDGSGRVSRIHAHDLAELVLAALARGAPRETYVVGDAQPAPHGEVARWLAQRLGVPVPPSAPLDSVSPTLRGDRAVDGSRALRDLGVTLRYPTWREGFDALLQAEAEAACEAARTQAPSTR